MKKSLGGKTLLYPHPVFVIGTYDDENRPNIMTASWAGICCSDPPAISVSVRKNRYTYENILKYKAFTVNIPGEKQVDEADYAGVYSGKDVDKFVELGLTPVDSRLVHAPYIEEFPVVLLCKVINVMEIGSHTQYIGEIVDVLADESVLGTNGLPIFEKVKPILYDSANRLYFSSGKLLSKAYIAKSNAKSNNNIMNNLE